jgi:hypothetical protein
MNQIVLVFKILKMNIFEIILNYESPNSSPFLEGIIVAQNNWINMKSTLDKLLDERIFESKVGKI